MVNLALGLFFKKSFLFNDVFPPSIVSSYNVSYYIIVGEREEKIKVKGINISRYELSSKRDVMCPFLITAIKKLTLAAPVPSSHLTCI